MSYYPKRTKVVMLRNHIHKAYKAGDIGFIEAGYNTDDIDGDCYEVRMYDNAECCVIGREDVALAPSDTGSLERKVELLEKLVMALVKKTEDNDEDAVYSAYMQYKHKFPQD